MRLFILFIVFFVMPSAFAEPIELVCEQGRTLLFINNDWSEGEIMFKSAEGKFEDYKITRTERSYESDRPDVEFSFVYTNSSIKLLSIPKDLSFLIRINYHGRSIPCVLFENYDKQTD